MKLLIHYLTKERIWLSEHTYQNKDNHTTVDAISIRRYKIGTCRLGIARYAYQVEHISPNDAEFKFENGRMITSINRFSNKHFKPNKLTFVNNVCVVEHELISKEDIIK